MSNIHEDKEGMHLSSCSKLILYMKYASDKKVH
jgi:hypothetical protein